MIKELLQKMRPAKATPTLYEMFGGWGNRIEWFDIANRKISGWKQRRPVVGDLIRCPMESGKSCLFKVISVNYMSDPADMFFAETKPIGYMEDYKGKYVLDAVRKSTFLV